MSKLLSYIDLMVVAFVVVQLINVMLSTFKSVLTVNGSPFVASAINSISYTFGAVIMKMITKQPMEVVIFVTLFTNLVGVYVAKTILNKANPIKLWTMIATIRFDNKDDIEMLLQKRDIKYVLVQAENDRYLLTVFCYSKGETQMAEEIMAKYGTKFTLTESRKWTEKE